MKIFPMTLLKCRSKFEASIIEIIEVKCEDAGQLFIPHVLLDTFVVFLLIL